MGYFGVNTNLASRFNSAKYSLPRKIDELCSSLRAHYGSDKFQEYMVSILGIIFSSGLVGVFNSKFKSIYDKYLSFHDDEFAAESRLKRISSGFEYEAAAVLTGYNTSKAGTHEDWALLFLLIVYYCNSSFGYRNGFDKVDIISDELSQKLMKQTGRNSSGKFIICK